MRTYTRLAHTPAAFLRDVTLLYRIRTHGLEEQAAQAVSCARTLSRRYQDATGQPLAGRRLLVVGTGQTLREVYALATLGADVTGIDQDVVPVGFDPVGYLRLWRRNGFVRLARTLGRRVLGVDRAFERALARQLGVRRLRAGRLLPMDAAHMSFADESFDAVYSFSVFEHLPDPGAVAREVRRVLAPGGLASVSVHLYSAEGGCHDLRILAGQREGLPLWAHLRPRLAHLVREGCYLNRWRLEQWHALFDQVFPGCVHEEQPHHAAFDARLRDELRALRAEGELAAYSDRELLTVNAAILWRKALGEGAPAGA